MFAFAIGTSALLSSCSSLQVPAVAYQSVLIARSDLSDKVPEDATILTSYSISPEGGLSVWIQNLTDNLMVVDQTKSFFINSTGTSTSYYDPTIRTSTKTNINSGTTGASVNLGAVASAFNIGGAFGRMASGINLGGANTSSQVVSNTDYITDMPTITIAPHATVKLDKVYMVKGIGYDALKQAATGVHLNLNSLTSYCTFGVTITYSVDGEETFQQLTTEFTANSLIKEPVQGSKKHWYVNDALRNIYKAKPNALVEPWYLLYFQTNYNVEGKTAYYHNYLQDYQ